MYVLCYVVLASGVIVRCEVLGVGARGARSAAGCELPSSPLVHIGENF